MFNGSFYKQVKGLAMGNRLVTNNGITLNNIPVVIELPWFVKKSSYIMNLRGIALLKRFIYNCRVKNKTERKIGYLTSAEINDAEKSLVKVVQQQVFPSTATIIAGLRIAKEQEVFYVVTKILNRQDTGRFRKPWLLPSVHPVVEQLIIEEHLKYGHAGTQFLTSKLREKFGLRKQ